MSLSVITPVKRRNFLSEGVVVREESRGGGKVERVPEGEYGLNKMPGSFQGERILWDPNKRRWDVDVSEKELQKIVKDSALRYLDGPNKGSLIEQANLKDPEDPFFTHKDFYLWLEEGHKEIDFENSTEKLIVDSLTNRSDFDKGGSDNRRISSLVDYLIVDKNHEREVKNQEAERRFDAMELIRTSSKEKKLKVAEIMKIAMDDNFTEKDINTTLLQIIDISPEKAEVYRNLCKLPKDDFEIKYLVHRGMSKGIIRKSPTRNQFMFNGEVPTGRTIEDSEDFFKNEENYGFLEELQEYIKK